MNLGPNGKHASHYTTEDDNDMRRTGSILGNIRNAHKIVAGEPEGKSSLMCR
jgi:hypothetical protein